jgi:hypothetical protein
MINARKGFEGSDLDLSEAIFRRFSGETEKNHESTCQDSPYLYCNSDPA